MSFRPFASFGAIAFVVLIPACGPAAVADPFDDTGELLALSGGDAGAAAACHTCHGLDGGGDRRLVPRIAGLDQGYLVRQLGFFADGQRRHPQMSWLAGRLDPQERLAVAAHYSAMPTPADPDADGSPRPCISPLVSDLYHRGVPERGLRACASCHGEDGAGDGPGNPPLAGQPAPYLARQLRDWREGKRYGDALGVMHAAASKLREDEISPLADYIAHGPEPSRRPGSRGECR
ncbi:c-type cytochrome [Tsuneonella sp. SYSU-LHT278]|uniref:c-type cytochrome n=1 Tax=Tsuneonella sediminis TaxID=3416089 RepID=UPI003F7A9355